MIRPGGRCLHAHGAMSACSYLAPPAAFNFVATQHFTMHAGMRIPMCMQLMVVPALDGPVVVWCSETEVMTGRRGRDPQRLRVCSSGNGAGAVLEERDVLRTAATTGTGRSFFK